MIPIRQRGRRAPLRARLRHSLHLPSIVVKTLRTSRSFLTDRARWVREACRLPVPGTVRVRQMLTRLRRPMSHSLRMRVLPRHSGHPRMRRRRFTIGVEGPPRLLIRRRHPLSISRRRVIHQRVRGIRQHLHHFHRHHLATVLNPRPLVQPHHGIHRRAPRLARPHQDVSLSRDIA